MKKTGAIIALATLVTVGGVYATWSYTGASDIIDTQGEMTVTMEDATFAGSNGIYTVKVNNGQIKIDQKGVGDHDAVLALPGNISVEVYFTVAKEASTSIKDNAVPTYFWFDTTTTMKYDDSADSIDNPVDVFKFTYTGYTAKTDDSSKYVIDWGQATDGTWAEGETYAGQKYFKYTFTKEALKSIIGISAINLDTKTEYDTFKNVLTGNIRINITDGTANTSANANS